MELPDDVLCLIKQYAKPYWTRNDWRLCGYRQSSLIRRYYEWQHMLYYEVQWNPLREWDGEKIVRYVNHTKMVQSILHFEHENGYTCSMREILRGWLQESLFSDLILLSD